MRRYLRILFPAFLFLTVSASNVFALEVPKRADGYVTDRAGLLSSSSKANLEALLRSFEEKTSNQVVVVTFPSLEGNSLEDFSMRLAETRKVGRKGKDNGVILLIFKNDRKIRIEVGYGLEGVLPDATAGQIISQVIAPYFRKGDYQSGIFAGVNAIIQATQGEFKNQSYPKINWFQLIFVIFILIFHLIFRPLAYGFGSGGVSGGFGGGGFSGGGGGFGGGGASGGW